ncbi:ATP-binding protein [Microbacterium testaceum]|uniref:ATP-binding protein n=1 Tax=Microbacterium testaceum TaxID=2033 RepID=UPI001CD9C493|nr:ATP-binding protein [Microbacterium testaceum]
MFDTVDLGENHFVVVSGLRGIGKTSFLSTLRDGARDAGWLVISDVASAGVTRSTIQSLVNKRTPEYRARLGELGFRKVDAEVTGLDRHRPVKPRLRPDLVALSAVLDGSSGILITIDEVSASKVRLRELSSFVLDVSHAIEDGAQIMVVFAGVHVDSAALNVRAHSALLRRSRTLQLERLSPPETRRVLLDTARLGGRTIEEDALDKLVSLSQGYPYLVQLASDYAWRHRSSDSAITVADATAVRDKAIGAVESRVLSRVYSDLSSVDQRFLDAMSQDDYDRTKIADIVKRMGVSDAYVQVYKKGLLRSGYVPTAGRGYVRFTLPHLGAHIRRQLTVDGSDKRNDDGWAAYPASDLPA